jgi:hypothetical protein
VTPDACLAGKQHHLAFTPLCLQPTPQQQFGFFLPPDQGGQAGRVQSVKAALHRTRRQGGPGPRRAGDALEVLKSEIGKFEEIAEQSARAVGDHGHVRLGQRLQARRQVRRVADNRLLLGGTRPDQIAHHDKPGRNADTHLQG